MHSLWIEAGRRLYLSCLEQGYVDELFLAIAPKWLFRGLSLNNNLCFISRSIAKASWRCFGDDAMCHLLFESP